MKILINNKITIQDVSHDMLTELKNRLELMAQMGYIEVINEKNCVMNFDCSSCCNPKQACSGSSQGSTGYTYLKETTAYSVTAKGERISKI